MNHIVSIYNPWSNSISTLKKRVLTALTVLASLGLMPCNAQSWIDVTENYLVNPGFDNSNATGWNNTYNASCNFNYGAMEYWQGTFDLNQKVSGLPNGKYQVSVSAYFRTKDNNTGYQEYQNSTEEITGYLYANDKKIALQSVYSASLTTNYAGGCWSPNQWGGWGGTYFPNTMQTGTYMFEQGNYLNQLEVNVTDGTLTLGLINESRVANNWCLFDNFRLEYWGTVKNITSIELSASHMDLIVGEDRTLTYSILPADATYRHLQFSCSDESVVTVDEEGHLVAVGTGTATITATATDEGGCSKSCTISVTENQATAESIIINELQQANVDMYIDPSFNYGSWIEVYNPTDKAVSLGGLYVSDDPFFLKKHQLSTQVGVVPAKGFKNIWFDHHEAYSIQVSFKLDCDGGTIYLSDENGKLIASQTYPQATSRTSYARTTDGGDTWAITPTPSPAASNNASTFTSTRCDAPVIDQDGCIFTGELTASVTIPQGQTLRYTLDGSTPSSTHGETSTTGVFICNETTLLRCCLTAPNMIPSPVVTRSFIKSNENYTLPIISVVTDAKHLYDDSLGIYVKGVNGRTGNGQRTPCNWNMDWDRPVNFEYFVDGKMVVNQEVDMAMCGGWSRAWEPHSFKLKAAKVYENKNFYEYPFFDDKPYMKHRTLQIRNGGNDNNCRIKDAAVGRIIATSGMDIDVQSYQPVLHFLNGEYKGLINMREPNNKHFAYANYGLDDEELDQFEICPDSGYVQKCGTDASFLKWYDLSANAADADTYTEIGKMVDIDEYINYMATEFYLGSTDWPQNNVKGFKSTLDGGKFRFVLFDVDFVGNTSDPFNKFAEKQNYTFDEIYDTGDRLTAEIKFVTIFLNMLKNEAFRKQFIDTYCVIAGSVFTPDRCKEIINTMATRVETMMAIEGRSPWSSANSLINIFSNRQSTLINALKNYTPMGLTDATTTQGKLSANIDQATLYINDIKVPTGKFEGSLFGPVTLKVNAPAGYDFVGWKKTENTTNSTIIIPSSQSSTQSVTWEYYDEGSLDGEAWTTGVDAASWNTGYTPLGYSSSNSGFNTILDYGNDAQNKRPTYYFRHTFVLDKTPVSSDIYTINMTLDDGAVVYINGTEVGRHLMKTGSVSYNDFASSYAPGNPDTWTLEVPTDVMKQGENTIAIEVHNNQGSSSDIYFDLELNMQSENTSNENIVSRESTLEVNEGEAFKLTAMFKEKEQGPTTPDGKALPPIRINEVSADNGIFMNDHYKKNDWIELYNASNEMIDVAGCYLSDNESIPNKYQIPTGDNTINTVIQPGDYLVIWCDKLDNISQLHASFKLAKKGGIVTLRAKDDSWVESLTYAAHTSAMSAGRYPDGACDTYLFDKPTIAAANKIDSYSTFIDTQNPPTSVDDIQQNTNNIEMKMERGMLYITGGHGQAHISINNMSGTQVFKQAIELEGNDMIALPTLPAKGVYIIHLTTAHGKKCTLKMMQ